MREILLTQDINELISVGQELPEGKYVLLVRTEAPVDQVVLSELQSNLQSYGADLLAPVSQTNTYPNEIQISFYHPPPGEGVGFAWLAVLPLIVPLATIGAIVFGIIKLEDIKNAIIPIILVAGGIAIVLASILQEPARKLVSRYV